MVEISGVLGYASDAQTYDVSVLSNFYDGFLQNGTTQNRTIQLMNGWLSSSLSTDRQHILGVFGDESSWSLTYNLYADALLGTNLVPQSVTSPTTGFHPCELIHALCTQILESHTQYLSDKLQSGMSTSS